MTGRLAGKRVGMVVAHEFEDIELLYPLLRLSEEGAEILIAAVPKGIHTRPFIENKPVTGRFGHPLPIPVMAPGNRYTLCTVKDLQNQRLDALIIPGGFSPDELRWDPETIQLVQTCHERGKVLAAICHGSWVLISAGIMKGRRATGWIAVHDDLVNAGAAFVDEPAVRDGNIVTARVPDDLPEFCQTIIEAVRDGSRP